MLAAALLALRLAEPLTPTLAADFDGDGREETVVAAPARGSVRLEVRADGRRVADAKAPSPSGDVVRVELSAGAIGSAGALLLVTASTDAAECASVWRYREASLTRLPLRGADGKAAADCAGAGAWNYRWESPGEGRPSELVRERAEKTAQGDWRVREAYAFAGFSLDADPVLSSRTIRGAEIPSWPAAVFYTTAALDALYQRYDLSRMRAEPTLEVVADRERGVFALVFASPSGRLEALVDGRTKEKDRERLSARAGEKTAQASVQFGGPGGARPVQVSVSGLGAPYDGVYEPAGSYHGRAQSVWASAEDEIAAGLVGTWADASGAETAMALDGQSTSRLRSGGDVYTIDRARAERPVDLILVPVGGSGRPWGITLRGANSLDRVPVVCAPPGGPCRSDGAPVRLRRLGARANAQ
ncbi:MAG TPA: hypothetical protein VMH79_06065 [Thermoanaerobaculia bacterium]|nr:hypothetical protein [Thermoanaerobaculia bacterium]